MEFHMGPANNNEEFEELGPVLRETPPRYLSFFSKLITILGGGIQQMGWGLMGFGMIFFWIFVTNSEARYILSFDGKWVESNGLITNIYSTNAEVNEQLVFAYEFSYNVQGKTVNGVSYARNQETNYQVNSPVPIQYKSKNIKRVKIEGMSSSIFPSWTVFVCIFPFIGFLFIFSGIYQNLKSLHLLIHGNFTRGKLKHKIPTNTRVNNHIVFKYEFEFNANGQQYTAVCRTYKSWKVEDEELEIILYLANNPKRSVVFDAIPSAPEISPRGELEPMEIREHSLLILPILSISINIILFYLFIYLDVF